MISAQSKMVCKSQLNNSATLNSHTDPSRFSPMLPDRLRSKRWAQRYSKRTIQVLVNDPEVVEPNKNICWIICSCLRNVTKSNNFNTQVSQLVGVLVASCILFQYIRNMKLDSLGVIIMMFVLYSSIQLTIFLLHTLIQALSLIYCPVRIQSQRIIYNP